MSEQTLQAQAVLSSWPWRLGTVVYEPVLGLDLASWDLHDLQENPQWVSAPKALLDPRSNYKKRGKALLEWLTDDQELLKTVYQDRSPEAEKIALELSPLPEEELDQWLKERGLSFDAIQLSQLDLLLEELLGWEPERHHQLLADWWERWEIPHRTGPSAFRQKAGPQGTVYGSFEDQARQVWQREIEGFDLDDFCLWSAMRVHWAWRIEFNDAPWPGLKVLDQLDQLFS